MSERITQDMIDCWRANYELTDKSPADAMRYWHDKHDGMAPAGAVAALGLLLEEREALREALNVAGGALFRLSPACIEDDEDRSAAEHARAVGLAAVEHVLKRGEQFPGVDIDAVHRKSTL